MAAVAFEDSITVDLSDLVTGDTFDDLMRHVDERFNSFESHLEAKIAESEADTLKAVMGMISGAVPINVLTILGSMVALVKILGH